MDKFRVKCQEEIAKLSSALNMQTSGTTGTTPQKLVFGQPSRGNIFPCARTGVVTKQEVSKSIHVNVGKSYHPVSCTKIENDR